MSIHVTRPSRKRAWAREKWERLKSQQEKLVLSQRAERRQEAPDSVQGRVWLFDRHSVKQKLKKVKNRAHWVTLSLVTFRFDKHILLHYAVGLNKNEREWRERGRGEYCSFFLFVLSVLGHWKLTRFARAALKTLHPKRRVHQNDYKTLSTPFETIVNLCF